MSDFTLTYCANVHPGRDCDELTQSLARWVARVAGRVGRDSSGRFPVGLWISGACAAQLEDPGRRAGLRDALDRNGVDLATVNAFPHGDFHARSVKREAYRPDWLDPARFRYTEAVARHFAALLRPEEKEGVLSTLPGSFKPWGEGPGISDGIACNLARLALGLSRLEQETGKRIVLALEPEPFCTLETTEEAMSFFRERLWRAGAGSLMAAGVARARAEEILRTQVGLCLDTCHLLVQYEDLVASYRALAAGGIRVGKIQLSSALEADAPFAALRAFDEPRYLHQVVARSSGGVRSAYEDLGEFLAAAPALGPWARARTHFHVPLFWEGAGALRSTRAGLARFLEFLAADRHALAERPILEIETYAWGVLPEPPADDDALIDGIAKEFEWVRSVLPISRT